MSTMTQEMTNDRRLWPFALGVAAVLIVSRVAADLFVVRMPLAVAWVPALLVYYTAIAATARILGGPAARNQRPHGSLAWPHITFGVVLPACLPAGFFVRNVAAVPWTVLVVIPVFAVINAWFEERFWRGVLAQAPLPIWGRIAASGVLFAFSHWFVTGAHWFAEPRVLWSVVGTTFVMGLMWMWFYLRAGRLHWVVASHACVDVLNLSVAMFLGLPMRTV